MAFVRPRSYWRLCEAAVLSLLGALFVWTNVSGEIASADSLSVQEEAAIRAAVARVADSVVQIRTIGGLEEVDRTLLADGPTTGLILSADGWIISSSFNFIHQPASILVTLPSGEQLPAELVAKDASRLLALLKIEGAGDLQVPDLAPPDAVRVGQWAIAVGRTFRADQPNVSVGILSARNRMFGKVLQTDADVSTANYGGPLVDIRGRVLGVIVPIAPRTASEVAGAEWYDSGIGFAAPLTGIEHALERMKRGEDQHAGVLGVGLEGSRPHESPAEIAAVMPNSPASRAGLRKGDRIVEIDGRPIDTQTDLRFALGPRYAGEEIQVTVRRGEQELTHRLVLTGELEPFRHAFLGIVPLRDNGDAVANPPDQAEASNRKPPDTDTDDDADAVEPLEEGAADAGGGQASDTQGRGVSVRMVFDGSPAARIGIQPGDRVLRIDDSEIDTIDDALRAMNAVWPEAEISVRIQRGDRQLDLSVRVSGLPTNISTDLPPAYEATRTTLETDAGHSDPDVRELKLAEYSQMCRVYVPPSHEAGRAVGMLLWLHAPGGPPNDDFFRRWRSICDRDGLLLVVPIATEASRWDRTELEYLRRLVERVLRQYRIDPHRVVVSGQAGGGEMAYLLALSSRDLFNGVATWSAAAPRTVRVPANQPTARLAILAGLPSDSRRLAQMRRGLKKFADAGYAVSMLSQADPAGKLTDEERQQMARWIDTLDRF